VTPKTTTIGSYPVFPKAEDVEYYKKMWERGLGDEVLDPYVWSIEESVKDFVAAGLEVVSTGQTRGDLYSLFLDSHFVKGVEWKGGEALVTGRLERRREIRLADVKLARGLLPEHFELREPITDAYTLAKFAKISGRSYADTRELAKEVNRKVVIPELESLQGSGCVSMLQLDSPAIGAESATPDFLVSLYEEVMSAAKLPVMLHACGDVSRVLGLLARTKVDVLSLDLYHFPHLLTILSRGGYDQEIGMGVLDSQNLIIESVEEISRNLEHGMKLLGEDRIAFVHPHCGQRNIDRQTAFRKNANMTMARDDVCFGKAEEAPRGGLTKSSYDRKGYFLVTLDRGRREIVVTFYSYDHRALWRRRSRRADHLLQSLNDNADRLGISRRHLSYLTLELGRAEASLASLSTFYRQAMIE